MLDALPYDTLLMLHLIAVAVFVSALLLLAASLPSLTAGPPDERRMAEARRLRSFHRWLATPALSLLWFCGAAMALEAGWYVQPWFQAKVTIVAGLSLTYLGLARRVARVAAGKPAPPARYRTLGLCAIAIVAILILVIAKPF